MRILVVGAGSIGGYFGGRLLGAGRDVTFLVHARRAAHLAQTGLAIRSPRGDLDLPAPPTITAEALRASDDAHAASEPFDLILLSVKTYDLEAAMDDFAPAVGPHTLILPLLNGMRHLDLLDERFGAEHVLGGQCVISTTLDPDGRIVHLGEVGDLSYGARDGTSRSRSAQSDQLAAIASALSVAGVESRLSEVIVQEMCEKWVFIATGAGITCLMRAAIGDIVAAGAADLAAALLDECAAIATDQGFAVRAAAMQQDRATFTAPGSLLTASMLRDIERGAPIEVEQIIGDLLRCGQRGAGQGQGQGSASPLLRIAYAHLKSYEARRVRDGQAPS
ncbi:MAG: ketopantoate reductase family protein [Ktedonobacterales bacterium]